MLTREEVIIKLGLKDPETFKFEAIKRNIENKLDEWPKGRRDELFVRCTGRTTNMLINAMVALSMGKRVFVNAATPSMLSYVWEEANRMAQRLNLPTDKLTKTSNHEFYAFDHDLP